MIQHYQKNLVNCNVTLPHIPDWAEPVWHLYVVRHPQRDALQKELANAGVGTLIHYPIPPHLQGAYANLNLKTGAFPISEGMHNEVLSLPIGPNMSLQDADAVIAAVRAASSLLQSAANSRQDD